MLYMVIYKHYQYQLYLKETICNKEIKFLLYLDV